MWSLISPRAKRIRGSKKILIVTPKRLFNTIDVTADIVQRRTDIR
jgi:hypothetical protein